MRRFIGKTKNTDHDSRSRCRAKKSASFLLAVVVLLSTIISGSVVSYAADPAETETEAVQTQTESQIEETGETEQETAAIPFRETVAVSIVGLVRAGVSTEEYVPQDPEFANVAIADVESRLNIRAEANSAAEVVGYLFYGDKGDIIERDGDWYHITSGNAEGWVNGEFLVTGNDARDFAAANIDTRATVLVDGLWVREEPAQNSAALATLQTGQRFIIIEEEDGWYKIEYNNSGDTGYISADPELVSSSVQYGTGVTMEEYEAMIEAQRAAEEAARRAAAQRSSSSQTSAQAPATTQGEATAANVDEAYLLACICRVESGSYDGMLAVANVVLNRVRSGSWPNSISAVIYQRGQFATGSRFQSYLANGPGSTAIAAANAALAGTNNIGGCMSFRPASAYQSDVVVGGNAFF